MSKEFKDKIKALLDQADTLYHEVCHADNPDLEDLELSLCGAVNELAQALEIMEEK